MKRFCEAQSIIEQEMTEKDKKRLDMKRCCEAESIEKR
jgi:hypothetical protein